MATVSTLPGTGTIIGTSDTHYAIDYGHGVMDNAAGALPHSQFGLVEKATHNAVSFYDDADSALAALGA